MARTPIELRVAGQTFRVVTSADPVELARLASVVDAKLRDLSGGKPKGALPPQMMLLAAIALAHDAEEAVIARSNVERRTRDVLRRTLMGIDEVLESPMLQQAAPLDATPLDATPLAPTADDAEHDQLERKPLASGDDTGHTPLASREATDAASGTGDLLSALLAEVSRPHVAVPLDLRLHSDVPTDALPQEWAHAATLLSPTDALPQGSTPSRPHASAAPINPTPPTKGAAHKSPPPQQGSKEATHSGSSTQTPPASPPRGRFT